MVTDEGGPLFWIITVLEIGIIWHYSMEMCGNIEFLWMFSWTLVVIV